MYLNEAVEVIEFEPEASRVDDDLKRRSDIFKSRTPIDSNSYIF